MRRRAEKNEESLEGILVGLLDHDLIDLYLYHDDGPPTSAPLLSIGHTKDIPVGWVEVLNQVGHDYQAVRWANKESITYGSFHPSLMQLIEQDLSSNAYTDLNKEEADGRRRLDGIAAGAAEAVGVDFFVTDRSHLTSSRHRHRNNWLNPPDALSLVSLYLRTQDVYLATASPLGHFITKFDKSMFFWVGTRELLPSAWRYVTGLMQHGLHRDVEDLRTLPLSVLERVQRVLESRDAIHQALNRSHSRQNGDDATSYFEVALLLLMAALDATAVIAHITLGLSGPLYHAGWQNDGWIARVEKTSGSSLARLFLLGSQERAALTILQRLRNSIHGAPLRNVTYKKGSGPDRSLFRVPKTKRDELLAAILALGGNEFWGVEEFDNEHVFVDPGVMIDRLVSEILKVLDKVMEATPIETLDGVNLTPEDKIPPSEDGSGYPSAFHERYRVSVRWQLGL